MRTVTVNTDHSARYERIAKGVYRFDVFHTVTGRPVTTGDITACGPTASVASDVQVSAANALRAHEAKRERASQAFATGEAKAPADVTVPAPIEQDRLLGTYDVSAALAVKIIRDAYATGPLGGESYVSWHERRNNAALTAGHAVLIGVADAVILDIAQGRATLHGSLRTGVTLVAIPA